MTRWIFLLLCMGTTLHAENCTVSGTVLDPSGAAVAGAAVRSGDQETVTDNHGVFVLRCRETEAYQVTVDANGFAQSVVNGTGTEKLTVHLRIAEVHTEIEVGESNGVSVDADHGAGTHTLTAEDLKGMADDPDDFKRQLQVLAATSGGAPGQAIITVDGFQNSSSLPPKSSIASIRVNPDLFSSEYDRPPYQGGRVEIFTKPGRDSLHGALFFNDSDSVLNATDPFALSQTAAGKRRYGFEFGGPIRKQKSDFFLALERRDIHEFNVVNAVVLNSENEEAPLSQNVPAPQRLWIGSARTDWQLSAKNMLAATYTANVNDSDNVGSGGLTLAEAGYNSTVSEQDLRLTDIVTLNPTLLHETHIGFTWKSTQDVPLSIAPSLQVAGAFTGGGATAGLLKNRERDLEVDDDVMWTHHKHSLKLGVASLGILVHDYDPDTFNGAFVFGGGLAPALDNGGQQTAISGLEQYRRTLLDLPGGVPTTYNVTQGEPLVPFAQWRVALFTQDQWSVRSNLSLSLGLRYALQTSPGSYGNLVPRVSLAWSPDHKQRWVLHVRGGLFSSPVTPDVTTEAYRLNGLRQSQLLLYSPSFNQPLAPTPSTIAVATTRQFAPNLSQSWSFQSQVGLEHQLPQHWHVQANLFDGQAWGTLRSRNINAPLVNDATTNPLLAPRPFAPGKNLFQFENTGHLHGQVIFVGADQHSYKRFGIFVGYLYFNLKTDADTATLFPQSSYSDHGETARASWESTHRLFAIGQLNLPAKLSLTSQFDASSGDPYNATTGIDNNGDGVFNDRPSLTTQQGTGTYQTPFGLLNTTAINGSLGRNVGTMPALVHLDTNLSRTFELSGHGLSTDRHQSVMVNVRAANLLNQTNVSAVGSVVGSPTFAQPLAAEAARRVEFGIRYTF
ncbi:MAG: carboxypeptidase regulatory-like domain-containing protein [Acidobacteriaceae bacterium]